MNAARVAVLGQRYIDRSAVGDLENTGRLVVDEDRDAVAIAVRWRGRHSDPHQGLVSHHVTGDLDILAGDNGRRNLPVCLGDLQPVGGTIRRVGGVAIGANRGQGEVDHVALGESEGNAPRYTNSIPSPNGSHIDLLAIDEEKAGNARSVEIRLSHMPDEVDVGITVAHPAPDRPVLLERSAVGAVGMNRLETDHGPGSLSKSGEIPVSPGPVVSVRRNRASLRPHIIEELDKIIRIVDKVLIDGQVVVAVIPAPHSLRTDIRPVDRRIGDHHRTRGIVGVRPGENLERVTQAVSIGVGVGRIGRRIAVQLVKIGKPIAIGVGVERIGDCLISVGEPVAIAVGGEGVCAGFVFAGIGKAVFIGIGIAAGKSAEIIRRVESLPAIGQSILVRIGCRRLVVDVHVELQTLLDIDDPGGERRNRDGAVGAIGGGVGGSGAEAGGIGAAPVAAEIHRQGVHRESVHHQGDGLHAGVIEIIVDPGEIQLTGLDQGRGEPEADGPQKKSRSSHRPVDQGAGRLVADRRADGAAAGFPDQLALPLELLIEINGGCEGHVDEIHTGEPGNCPGIIGRQGSEDIDDLGRFNQVKIDDKISGDAVGIVRIGSRGKLNVVVKSVFIAVGVDGVGTKVEFFGIGEAVSISIGIARVGPALGLFAISEPIPIGVGHGGIRADETLGIIAQPIVVEVALSQSGKITREIKTFPFIRQAILVRVGDGRHPDDTGIEFESLLDVDETGGEIDTREIAALTGRGQAAARHTVGGGVASAPVIRIRRQAVYADRIAIDHHADRLAEVFIFNIEGDSDLDLFPVKHTIFFDSQDGLGKLETHRSDSPAPLVDSSRVHIASRGTVDQGAGSFVDQGDTRPASAGLEEHLAIAIELGGKERLDGEGRVHLVDRSEAQVASVVGRQGPENVDHLVGVIKFLDPRRRKALGIEGIKAEKELFAIEISVSIGIGQGWIGPMLIDLFSIVQAVVVAVGLQRAGIELDLRSIIEAILVGIRRERIRAAFKLGGIVQTVRVRVGLAIIERVEIPGVEYFPRIGESISVIIDEPGNIVRVGVKGQAFIEVEGT